MEYMYLNKEQNYNNIQVEFRKTSWMQRYLKNPTARIYAIPPPAAAAYNVNILWKVSPVYHAGLSHFSFVNVSYCQTEKVWKS